ncbi:MAG: hypothetical protein IIW14_03430, partial [Kiritimatiellae bacterium]|nr:hypothetical protein [Kiritimatiellia bacterium]
IQRALNGIELRLSKSGKIYVKGRNGLPAELAEIFGKYPTIGQNDGIREELASALGNGAYANATPEQLVDALKADRANYDEWVKAQDKGKSLEDQRQEAHYADEAAREKAEARERWENSGMGVLDYIRSRAEEGVPEFDLDWEIAREMARDFEEGRFSIGGIYTGSAADYANRSRQGGVDDGPSLVKIGSGEGSQVYGWGLYGSTVRGVAERYARANRDYMREITFRGKTAEQYEQRSAENLALNWVSRYGSPENAVREVIETWEGKLPPNVAKAADILRNHKSEFGIKKPGNIYEQTFFTDRAPGDESHLLKWYEPVSEEQKQWIRDQLKKEGLDASIIEKSWRRIIHRETGHDLGAYDTGNDVYDYIVEMLGSPKAASEFLARAGIDGVKYPVDSYGGKGVKDGDKVGWNYVSFRDDNIRVDHKWIDGEAKFMVGWALKHRGKDGKIPGVDQKRLTAVMRGLGSGELKHPRFTKEEAAASGEVVHERLWYYILSLESPDVYAGGTEAVGRSEGGTYSQSGG